MFRKTILSFNVVVISKIPKNKKKIWHFNRSPAQAEWSWRDVASPAEHNNLAIDANCIMTVTLLIFLTKHGTLTAKAVLGTSSVFWGKLPRVIFKFCYKKVRNPLQILMADYMTGFLLASHAFCTFINFLRTCVTDIWNALSRISYSPSDSVTQTYSYIPRILSAPAARTVSFIKTNAMPKIIWV
jgi:hypothetical protein